MIPKLRVEGATVWDGQNFASNANTFGCGVGRAMRGAGLQTLTLTVRHVRCGFLFFRCTVVHCCRDTRWHLGVGFA